MSNYNEYRATANASTSAIYVRAFNEEVALRILANRLRRMGIGQNEYKWTLEVHRVLPAWMGDEAMLGLV